MSNAAGKQHWIHGEYLDIREPGRLQFTYINDADYHLRGCPREAVIGQSLVDLFTEEGRSIIAQVLARRRESVARGEKNTILKFEAPQVCQNGRLLWVEVHAAPFHNQSGQTVGYIGITRPVGEHGRMESLLEENQREVHRQQQEIAQLRLSLQEQALRDPLTGLHNRRYLDETFPRELSRARREGYPLSLILVGVDHFKTINESHGHAGGDAVLQALSLILNLGARDSDIFCRYGNKEFLVVCPLMGLDDAQRIGRIRVCRVRRMGRQPGRLIHDDDVFVLVEYVQDHGLIER